MQLLENLKKIGVPGETLNLYLEKGLIKSDGLGTWQIVNGDLLINLITKCLACKIKPDFLIIPENVKDFDDELEVLYTHLLNHNYMMSATVAEMINKELHTSQLDLFIDTCKKYQDVNTYVLYKEEYGKDQATREGLQKLERKLLIELELYDYINAIDTAELLVQIYSDYNTDFNYNLASLLRLLKDFSEDETKVGNSSEEVFSGPSSYVLNMLLEFEDIYRADDLINDEIKKNPYSLEWAIYFSLMYQIKILNEKNMKNAIHKTIFEASLSEDNEWAFPVETFPRLTKDEVLQIKNGVNLEVDDKDYYSEYEEALLSDGDYSYAKECLEKFQKQEVLSMGSENYDYLFEELDILIENEKLGVDMQEYNTALNFVMYYMEMDKYDLALNYAAKCYNMLIIKNPRIECILGKIYYTKGDLDKADRFYSDAFGNPVSPDDLADMIEVFFEKGEYVKVIGAVQRFDYYDAMQNAKVHYLAAAAYLKLGKYDDARNALQLCTTIVSADENLPIDYEEEREIIDEAENGEDKSFGLEDYVDYESTDEECLIAQYLDQNVIEAEKVFDIIKTDKENYSENLKYLLSVTKALFQSYDFDKGLEFCERLDEVFDTKLLSKEDAKVMKKIINNLKRI